MMESKQDIFKIVDRGIIKEAKYCIQCNKIFTNRKKWGEKFEEVKFCSQKCKINYKLKSK